MTPPCNDPVMPTISVQGWFKLGGSGNDQQDTVSQTFAAQDQVSWVKGKHTIRADWLGAGGESDDPGVTRGTLTFESFPDFLLGMSAAQNGSAFRDVFSSSGACGDTSHSYRTTDLDSYVQDDFAVRSEADYQCGRALGSVWRGFGRDGPPGQFRSLAGGDESRHDPHAARLRRGQQFPLSIPSGVVANDTTTYTANPRSLGNVGPRLGFGYQPFSRFVGSRRIWNLLLAHVGERRVSPVLEPAFLSEPEQFGCAERKRDVPRPLQSRAAELQRVSGVVALFFGDGAERDDCSFKFQIAGRGSVLVERAIRSEQHDDVSDRICGHARAAHQVTQALNGADLASAADPIRGITTNTVQNAAQRVPYLGFSPTGISNWAELGDSKYNGLQTMLTQKLRYGLQFQASYTYSKALTDVTGNGTFPNGGSLLNNNLDIKQNWGPADFDIRNRFVANLVYDLPAVAHNHGFVGKTLSDWSVSGVIVIQSGPPLTFTDSRSGTIYGFANQRAQLCPGITASQVITPGPIESKLNDFFNAGAFCAPSAIGNGFDFGDSGRGIVYGPGQHNVDLAVIKEIPIKGFTEGSHLEFRGEFYNAFNTPQFASTTTVQGATQPTAVGTLNFGQINTLSVAPRLIQLGLKYIF